MRAYEKGYQCGVEGDKTRRHLMSFGLSCAGDSRSEDYARQWLKGFDEALKNNQNRPARRTAMNAWWIVVAGMMIGAVAFVAGYPIN